MHCEHCGALLTNSINFCPHCGGKLHTASASQGQPDLNPSGAVKGKLAWDFLTMVVVGVGVIFAATILLWVLYRSGSSTGYPSDADASKLLENLREQQLREAGAEILNFKKVNAEAREILGVLLYTVDYEAEIKYPKGLNLAFGHCTQPSTPPSAECQAFLSSGSVVRNKGETEKLHGQVTFKKSDKGWQGEDGNFY